MNNLEKRAIKSSVRVGLWLWLGVVFVELLCYRSSSSQTWPSLAVSQVQFSGNHAQIIDVVPSSKRSGGIRVVDAKNQVGWSGADLGEWFNSAYQDCTGSFCAIKFIPDADGNCTSYSTPIVFASPGKVVLVDMSGGCIDYLPTTATKAVRLDYMLLTSSSFYTPENGFINGELRNHGGCGKNGGCGSSATGVFHGTGNGAAFSTLENFTIKGFGKAIDFASTAANGWGVNLKNFDCAWNTICLDSVGVAHEDINWTGGACVVNETCIHSTVGSEFNIWGVSCDSNTGVCISGVPIIHWHGGHMENLNSTVLNYANMSAGLLDLEGVQLLDDQISGTVNQMFTISGALAHLSGVNVFSGGRTITNLFNVSGSSEVWGDYSSTSPSKILNDCSSPIACDLKHTDSLHNNPYSINSWFLGGPIRFQASSGSSLAPVRFVDASGSDTWAVGNKDSGGSSTKDLIVSGTSSIRFGQKVALSISATNGAVSAPAGFQVNSSSLLLSPVAPTIASGFGTSPSISQVNGAAAFAINLGRSPEITGTLNMPTAANGWNCFANDVTSPTVGGGYYIKETGGTTTTVVLTFYNTSGVATPPMAADKILVNCTAY